MSTSTKTPSKKGKALPGAELPPAVDAPKTLRHEDVPPALLVDSPINPRKTYDEGKIAELATSMRLTGWFGEVLARPKDDHLELVAGHRRKRAAILAGLATIRVEVREFDDHQARLIMLRENGDRSDLHPLEESDAYRALIGEGESIETLAAQLGRTVGFVRARLRLGDLGAEGRELFLAGRLGTGHAFQLAALKPEGQALVIKDMQRWQDLPSAAELTRTIQRLVMMSLDKVPWDLEDAELLPSAGSCTACPRRAGAAPELFPEGTLDKGDRCLDRACFERKEKALVDRRVREVAAKKKVDEAQVLRISEDWGSEGKAKSAAAALAEQKPLVADAWRELGGKKCASAITAVVASARTWEPSHIGKKKEVCTDRSCKTHWGKNSPGGGVSSAGVDRKAQEKARAKRRLEERARELTGGRVVAAVIEKLKGKGLGAEELRFLVERHWERAGAEESKAFGAAHWGPDVDEMDAFNRDVEKASAKDLGLWLLELTLLEAAGYGFDMEARELLKRHKVDRDAIGKQVQAELESEAQAKKSAAPAKAQKGKKK